MRIHNGTFTKKNGDPRPMTYVRLEDLPTGFIDTQLTGSGTQRNLAEGQELVWDVVNNGFRVFNHNTVIGEVTVTEEVTTNYFPNNS